MKHILHINQQIAIQNNLTLNECLVLDEISDFLKYPNIHNLSIRKIIKINLPILDLKEDTIYRYLKNFHKHGFIVYASKYGKDEVVLTEKGKKIIEGLL